jgi:hypothetical protein
VDDGYEDTYQLSPRRDVHGDSGSECHLAHDQHERGYEVFGEHDG